ncbi:hypothetical protein E4U11_005236 [Claviceps purpurea]|nr:hypothetical protein E4U11_005236 [Claviceps purpurea]
MTTLRKGNDFDGASNRHIRHQTASASSSPLSPEGFEDEEALDRDIEVIAKALRRKRGRQQRQRTEKTFNGRNPLTRRSSIVKPIAHLKRQECDETSYRKLKEPLRKYQAFLQSTGLDSFDAQHQSHSVTSYNITTDRRIGASETQQQKGQSFHDFYVNSHYGLRKKIVSRDIIRTLNARKVAGERSEDAIVYDDVE